VSGKRKRRNWVGKLNPLSHLINLEFRTQYELFLSMVY
jgi:hypothetical protein